MSRRRWGRSLGSVLAGAASCEASACPPTGRDRFPALPSQLSGGDEGAVTAPRRQSFGSRTNITWCPYRVPGTHDHGEQVKAPDTC